LLLQDGTPLRRLLTLVPCLVLLVGSYATMLSAALALRSAAAVSCPAISAATFFIDFPTGLNAGWLAAAAGIGVTYVAHTGPQSALAGVGQRGRSHHHGTYSIQRGCFGVPRSRDVFERMQNKPDTN
jgi:hypothetical protein